MCDRRNGRDRTVAWRRGGRQCKQGEAEPNPAVAAGRPAPDHRCRRVALEARAGGTTIRFHLLRRRIWQFTAGQEFLVSQTAALFVNSTFGWAIPPAQDLPSGGPSYPEATPGVRLTWTPSDQITVRAAIFNGDPAGPGPGNPVDRDPYGLAFRLRDPPLIVAELAYAWNQDKSAPQENPHQEGGGRPRSRSRTPDLPGSVKLGGWLHTGQFDDQRFDSFGGLLAVSGATPLQHRGNLGLYSVVDQMLWRAPGNGHGELSVFMRGVVTPSDRNLIDLYFDAGLTYLGLFDSRPDDTIGLA